MITIIELLNKEKIPHKKSGQSILISCLSPQHPDKHPSMKVNPSTGDCICFACGHTANIYKYFGITLNRVDTRAYKILQAIDKKRNPSIEMPEGSKPWNETFRGISAETFERFGVFKNPIYYKDKICIPIKGFDGTLKAIQTRDIHSKVAKYYTFPDGKALPVLPLDVKPYKSTIIVSEGVFDVMNSYENSLKNVICTFGINITTSVVEQIISIASYKGATRVVLAFDNDEAGRKGTALAQKLLEGKVPSLEVLDWSIFEREVKDLGELTQDDFFTLHCYLFG